jgi:hypothetical protein
VEGEKKIIPYATGVGEKNGKMGEVAGVTNK